MRQYGLPSRSSRYALPPGRQTLLAQFVRYARAAIRLIWERKGGADKGENQVLSLTAQRGQVLPGEGAAWVHLEEFAQTLNGELSPRRIDELEPHRRPS